MQELDVLITTAIEAGNIVLSKYGFAQKVTLKNDHSPVTEADALAEDFILSDLKKYFPHIPAISEEAADHNARPTILERFFLVDPLDGTKEFLSGNGEFTINIALVENGSPIWGVVYAPALKQIWWGGTGGTFAADTLSGTIVNQHRVTVRRADCTALTAIGSRSHKSDGEEELFAHYQLAGFIGAGSSLKFCRLAEGSADLYPRLGRTMEWDTAAGHAILSGAGGRVVTLDNTPLNYGKTRQSNDADFANPHFVAFGDPHLNFAPKIQTQHHNEALHAR